MTGSGHDGFRMKLDAFDTKTGMAYAHYYTVLSAGCHYQGRGLIELNNQ
jgi:hypothetical protein